MYIFELGSNQTDFNQLHANVCFGFCCGLLLVVSISILVNDNTKVKLIDIIRMFKANFISYIIILLVVLIPLSMFYTKVFNCGFNITNCNAEYYYSTRLTISMFKLKAVLVTMHIIKHVILQSFSGKPSSPQLQANGLANGLAKGLAKSSYILFNGLFKIDIRLNRLLSGAMAFTGFFIIQDIFHVEITKTFEAIKILYNNIIKGIHDLCYTIMALPNILYDYFMALPNAFYNTFIQGLSCIIKIISININRYISIAIPNLGTSSKAINHNLFTCNTIRGNIMINKTHTALPSNFGYFKFKPDLVSKSSKLLDIMKYTIKINEINFSKSNIKNEIISSQKKALIKLINENLTGDVKSSVLFELNNLSYISMKILTDLSYRLHINAIFQDNKSLYICNNTDKIFNPLSMHNSKDTTIKTLIDVLIKRCSNNTNNINQIKDDMISGNDYLITKFSEDGLAFKDENAISLTPKFLNTSFISIVNFINLSPFIKHYNLTQNYLYNGAPVFNNFNISISMQISRMASFYNVKTSLSINGGSHPIRTVMPRTNTQSARGNIPSQNKAPRIPYIIKNATIIPSNCRYSIGRDGEHLVVIDPLPYEENSDRRCRLYRFEAKKGHITTVNYCRKGVQLILDNMSHNNVSLDSFDSVISSLRDNNITCLDLFETIPSLTLVD